MLSLQIEWREAFKKDGDTLSDHIPVVALGNPCNMHHVHERQLAPLEVGSSEIRLNIAGLMRAEAGITNLLACWVCDLSVRKVDQVSLQTGSNGVLPLWCFKIAPVLQKLIAVFVAEANSITCLTAVIEHGIEILVEVACSVGDVLSEPLDLDSIFRGDQLTWLMK